MARPKTYTKRIDTKVRIREDQAERMTDLVGDGTYPSRNAIIEAALDGLLKTKRPRLRKADPGLSTVPAQRAASGQTHRPRLAHLGEAHAAQVEAKAPSPPTTAKPLTRVVPRSRRR